MGAVASLALCSPRRSGMSKSRLDVSDDHTGAVCPFPSERPGDRLRPNQHRIHAGSTGADPMSDTLARVQVVFRDLFDDPDLTVHQDTTASDVANWDSMMHVSLMLAVERAFKIRFTSSEVASLKNVGELVSLVDRKASSRP
jgi:acyl carrier protein